MAAQIKKKFIGSDQVGANQLLIESGSAVRAMDGATEVELVKVLSSETYLNGFKVLETSGLIDSNRLPSYVDDVLEFADLASFPATGETGKIYIALDTNKQYRWSGSVYVQITSGAVDSVNGETGIVVLSAGDILMDSEATSVEAKLVSLQGEIDAEETARATLEGEFDAYVISNDAALAQEISDRIADVDAEEARALAAEGVLQGNIDTVSAGLAQEILDRAADVDAEEARALAAEGVLQGNIDTVAANLAQEIIDRAADVDAEEARALAAESALDGRVSTLEAIVWYSEKFVVDATILSNGFVTLANTPESGSVIANVDRLSIFEGAAEDFTMAGAVMTFLNQLVSPGNQALQVGDEIRVKYRA